MAYAVLLSLAQTLDNILLFRDEFRVLDEEPQMRSLQQKLNFFISFLEENNDLIEELEERIRDAVYEAEDVIETHMSKQILSKSISESDGVTRLFWDCARCFLSKCQNSEENNEEEDLEKKIYEQGLQNVIGKLDSIGGEVEKMKDNNNNTEALQIGKNPLTGPVKLESTSEIGEVKKMQSIRDSSSSKSAPTNTSVPIVGFEDDRLQIKELLVGPSDKLEAILIVGMGGIGKTTLARNIYNGSFVNDRFDVRAWTTISQTYDEVTLLANLLTSMGKNIDEMNRKDPDDLKQFLKQKLYQSLKEKRYLIVMDDVWDTDFLKELRNIFPDDKNGSRIIMTSQLSDVDGATNFCSHIHHMNFLSPEQSWNLLRQKALGDETCPPELEEIGWKIVEKCKGLPLALVVIGGALYKEKKTPQHWKYVEENLKSSRIGNYDDLMEKLSWSYNHLPHHLKACFLYMAVYPEDYVIHISHLIRLWLAEGFIKPIPPKKLEQVAKEYLEDLISRNMIIVHQRSYYGEIKTCTMHDLIRDFCMREAKKKMFLHVIDNNDQEAIENKRCLSSHREWYYLRPYGLTVIRSLLYFKFTYADLKNIHSPLLRVLDASNIAFEEFPVEVVKLVNLRYLAFFYNGNGHIPASISKLCNLQTLIIMRNWWQSKGTILYLPPEMFKMKWLRHLLVDGSSFLSYPPGEPNGNLQVLSGLINFKFTKDAIENILELKTLEIVYRFVSGTEWSSYCMENVADLHQLEILKLQYFAGKAWEYATCQMPLNLSFPENLNKLTLEGCICSGKQLSMIGLLPNLQVLQLKYISFEKSIWKTNEGEFNELKFLFIESDTLKDWELAEGTHFPSLESLSLSDCWRLKCIPPGIGEIPNLRHIVLNKYCSPGVVDSANEVLKEQHKFGNESLQLHQGYSTGFRKRDKTTLWQAVHHLIDDVSIWM